jgi:hypothetical protein
MGFEIGFSCRLREIVRAQCHHSILELMETVSGINKFGCELITAFIHPPAA